MRTFKEFLELTERYYEPDEDLPSGKTPVEKATRKSRSRSKTIGSESPENQERWEKQYDLTQTKVKHGADNPEPNARVSFKDKDDVKVSSSRDELDVYHKPSGVYYSVRKSEESPYDGVRTIEWNHDKQRQKNKLSPLERVRIARDAQKVWDQHVSPRLPNKSIVHNTPATSYDDRGNAKPVNRRAELYKRAGFGETDNEGDQFAQVGREPSPKQKATGKTRLKPLDPRKAKDYIEWDRDEDDNWEMRD